MKRKWMTAEWQEKITRDEFRHIQETTSSGTLAQFKRNRKKSKDFPCMECRDIARKLGIEDESTTPKEREGVGNG
jgi:hypothetical protein